MLKKGAGEWSCCIDDKAILPERGRVEQVTAAFSGWLQTSYLAKDYCIELTQYDRKTAGTF